MKKGIFVEDITKENMEVDSSFIVIKKAIFTSKNNTKYMSLELKDKTGKIEGKIEAAKIMLEIGLSKSEITGKLGLKETDF